MAEDNVNKLFRLIVENQEPLEITKDLVEIAIKKYMQKPQMKKNGHMK